jgi:hypothetical protein
MMVQAAPLSPALSRDIGAVVNNHRQENGYGRSKEGDVWH